ATLKLLDTSDTIRQRYLQQSQQVSPGLLLSALNIANHCAVNYRTSKNQRLQVELALLKMCHIAAAIQLAKNGPAEPLGEAAEKKKPMRTQASVDSRQSSVDSRQSSVDSRQSSVDSRQSSVDSRQSSVDSQPVGQEAADHRPPNADAQPTAPKARSWGNVKLSNVIPDLNNILADKQADEKTTDEPELLSGTERQPFDHELLLQHWHALADKLKAENKINLFTLMTANAPQLQPDFNIGVVIENPIQHELLNTSKIDILNELRTNLHNFAIDLVPIKVKQDTRSEERHVGK